jgi:hypothetical protein
MRAIKFSDVAMSRDPRLLPAPRPAIVAPPSPSAPPAPVKPQGS